MSRRTCRPVRILVCSGEAAELEVTEACYSSWESRKRFNMIGKDKMAQSKRNTVSQRLEDEGVSIGYHIVKLFFEVFYQKSLRGI